MSAVCVITTIHPPTAAVRAWHERFGDRLIVIGDRKTPADWQCGNARYYSIERQKNLPLDSVPLVPEHHYARKNIGYLQAFLHGASCVFDTDDDNAPNKKWAVRSLQNKYIYCVKKPGWCNIYTLMCDPTNENLWPRGFPLNRIEEDSHVESKVKNLDAPIQQGLADGNPDVDAVWRLVLSREVKFSASMSIALAENVWCPFNSQATWWFPEAYELMYLPIHATFRMTDIWRSFVAQRCLWAIEKSVAFHSPAEVEQERNPHDLMKDFESEIPGYLHNEKIAAALEKLPLKSGVESMAENMQSCYTAMIDLGVLPKEELVSLNAWLGDVRRVRRN